MAHRNWDLACKVYIGNLGDSASKHEIESTFNKYGPLKNVWIARNPPGFAFVEYEDPRDAEDAVRGLDGTRLCGNRIRVEMSSGRSRQQSRGGRGGGGGGGRDYRRYGGNDNYSSRSRGSYRKSGDELSHLFSLPPLTYSTSICTAFYFV
ncbi:RNA-binding protein 1-like isoform X2 [Planococcus citri]|uniref:RNA-binding protein 1-like isoform X2 n=1 Tax=Planococcus citri TaxID=170843 RepID=UPI0031F96689